MNDKKDLNMAIKPMIEWCGRYASLTKDDTSCNWELYVWERIIAYNYDVADGYIVKYASLGSFPEGFKLEVSYNHELAEYSFRKKFI